MHFIHHKTFAKPFISVFLLCTRGQQLHREPLTAKKFGMKVTLHANCCIQTQYFHFITRHDSALRKKAHSASVIINISHEQLFLKMSSDKGKTLNPAFKMSAV